MDGTTIRAVLNGFVVEGAMGGDELVQTVYESPETDTGEAEALARALWNVIERLGMNGSKHDAARVRVVVEPGDKWVAPEA